MEKNELYPVFLKMDKLNILLVGAGNVGAEKLQSILSNSPAAQINVIADRISKEVTKLAVNHWNVRLIQRKFSMNDIEGRDLVFLATDNYDLHKEIIHETRKRKILANVADTPALCDFYLGSIVQKGQLKIGVSTNGKSPTVSKRIRQFLENVLPDNVNILINNLHEYRNKLSGDFQMKVNTLNEATKSLIEDSQVKKINQN